MASLTQNRKPAPGLGVRRKSDKGVKRQVIRRQQMCRAECAAFLRLFNGEQFGRWQRRHNFNGQSNRNPFQVFFSGENFDICNKLFPLFNKHEEGRSAERPGRKSGLSLISVLRLRWFYLSFVWTEPPSDLLIDKLLLSVCFGVMMMLMLIFGDLGKFRVLNSRWF